jgi:predicted metalloendopeptidase
MTKSHKNKRSIVGNKTRKNALTKNEAFCMQRYKNVESRYADKHKDQISKGYKEMHHRLVKDFKIPFSPSTITPQNDFYSYINYRWIQQTVKKYKSKKTENRYYVEVDIFRVVQDKVYRELFGLVDKFIKTETGKKRDAINNVYKSLLYLDSGSLRKHLKELEPKYQMYQKSDNYLDWMASLNENEIISWGAPIYWRVAQDPKDSDIFCDIIDPPILSLYDYLLYLGDYGQTPKYIAYKKKVVSHFIRYVNNIFDACFGTVNGFQGKDVFEVEVELLTLMGCDDIKNEDPNGYNKLTHEEAMDKCGFDWNAFSKFLGYKTPPKYFIASNINYLKCISKYLKDNWRSKKFKTYIFYIILRQMIRFDNKLINIYYNFNNKFIKGQPDPFPRNLYPIFGLSLTFNTFLTNEYVGAYWNQVNADFVQDIATNLLTVFKRIMKRNTWLTNETKLYALKKLDHLELTIARPKKLREDPLLDYEPKDAWYNMSLIGKWRKDKYIKLQGKEIVDVPLIDWKQFKLVGTQAYVVNAYYEMNKNKIFVPLAIMQHPFINLDERGLEYNLARIGYTLGHEMSHALDNTGSKYDYKGNLHNWWKPSDRKKYDEIVKNIIKQYETFASYDGVKFNAELTVGEDMADISGMAICQEYLLDYFEVNNTDVPIRELNLKEFYVHYASHQRQHIYKRALNAQLHTNPHPLDKYRTNCVLARLEIFKVIYDIKKGDKMWWPTNDVNSTIWN